VGIVGEFGTVFMGKVQAALCNQGVKKKLDFPHLLVKKFIIFHNNLGTILRKRNRGMINVC
jgi:hypothetical protein